MSPSPHAIELVPLMHQWVDDNYPGTKLAITEYNFGEVDTTAGALAQADILGIFGREGLDLAALFGMPGDNQMGEDAFLIFRDYDGAGSQFGDTSIASTKHVVTGSSGNDTEILTSYAAEVTTGVLTVLLINKDTSPNTVIVSLSNVDGNGTFRSFPFRRLRKACRGAGSSASGQNIDLTLPERTAMLVEYTAPGAVSPGGGTSGGSSGSAGGTSGGTSSGAATSGGTTGGAETPLALQHQKLTGGCACREDASGGAPLALLFVAWWISRQKRTVLRR